MQIGPTHSLLHAIGTSPAPPVPARQTPAVQPTQQPDAGSTEAKQRSAAFEPRPAASGEEKTKTGDCRTAGVWIDIQV